MLHDFHRGETRNAVPMIPCLLGTSKPMGWNQGGIKDSSRCNPSTQLATGRRVGNGSYAGSRKHAEWISGSRSCPGLPFIASLKLQRKVEE